MEHGGWGFLLEPIVLGLLLAWSWQGLGLSIAAIASFLLRQPLKILWSDYVAGRRTAREPVAIAVAAGYGAIAALGLVFAFRESWEAIAPLLIAGPLVLGLLWYDARGRSRDLAPELLAPVALAAVGASIVMLGGWSLASGCTVWALLSLRAVPSVLYVRGRLRLGYGRPTNLAVPAVAHLLAIALAVIPAVRGLAPLSVIPLYALLFLRSAVGLSRFRRKASAKAVGFSEIGWGLASVAWIVLAFRLA
jgi:hypothetical protein